MGENSNVELIVIILQGVLLLMSELLPFCKATKCNGLSHAIYKTIHSECLKRPELEVIVPPLPPPENPAGWNPA